MKKVLHLLALFTLGIANLSQVNAQTTRYIKQGGTATAAEATSWATACDSLQAVINLSASGDTILVAAGTYKGSFILKEGITVLGGFPANADENTTMQHRKLPGTGENLTILDGQDLFRVLTQDSNYTTETVWEGFVLQNGRAANGGGAYLQENGVLRNSIVQHCKAIVPAAPGVTMVPIPGGEFNMGCAGTSIETTNSWCYSYEKPQHSVRVGDFYMSESEVTNAQYCAFLNAVGVPSTGKYTVAGYGEQMLIERGSSSYQWGVKHNGTEWVPEDGYSDYPVIYVSWYGAQAYCNYYGFRLPTEAEWEYAARGGTDTLIYSGAYENTQASLDSVSWNTNNSGSKTHLVQTKRPNAYGLYDMTGNVWEWTSSYWTSSYSDQDMANPSSSGRVYRGGSWYIFARGCRVSYRINGLPGNRSGLLGFRVCL